MSLAKRHMDRVAGSVLFGYVVVRPELMCRVVPPVPPTRWESFKARIAAELSLMWWALQVGIAVTAIRWSLGLL